MAALVTQNLTYALFANAPVFWVHFGNGGTKLSVSVMATAVLLTHTRRPTATDCKSAAALFGEVHWKGLKDECIAF
jgi:hypothetical protein